MPLVVLGTNHHSAPIALRERLAFPERDLGPALESAREAGAEAELADAELVILSTCNRTELYLAAEAAQPAVAALASFVARTRGVAPEVLLPRSYWHVGVEALRHLCAVAAGLDSMVIGEVEILKQVRQAQDASRAAGTLGPVLEAAFQTALRAGRRARAETGICREPASIPSEAVALLARELDGLGGRRVLLVGTGTIARHAGEGLRDAGVTDLLVAGRTPCHAEDLGARLGAVPVPWDEVGRALCQADAVVSATSAPHVVLTADLVAGARSEGDPRPLLLVDTALPRDVDPAVRGLPAVRLFDLDDLQRRIRENLALREREGPRVSVIIAEEVERFQEWRRGSALGPLIAAMRQRAEEIRRGEVERLLHRLPDLPIEARRQVDQLSRALVNKLLHEPTVRLRAEADPALRGTYARVAEVLFGTPARESAPGTRQAAGR